MNYIRKIHSKKKKKSNFKMGSGAGNCPINPLALPLLLHLMAKIVV